MTDKQNLMDLLLQQRETISSLLDVSRRNYDAYLELTKQLYTEKNYWEKRAEKAENELIDLKLFGKTQPQPK